MSRKETVIKAIHVLSDNEIRRIMEYYQKIGIHDVTILEASAIQAQRSMDVLWSDTQAKKSLARLRGLI